MAFVHYRLRRHHALGSALISSVAALGVGLFIGTYIAGVRVNWERADSHAVSTRSLGSSTSFGPLVHT